MLEEYYTRIAVDSHVIALRMVAMVHPRHFVACCNRADAVMQNFGNRGNTGMKQADAVVVRASELRHRRTLAEFDDLLQVIDDDGESQLTIVEVSRTLDVSMRSLYDICHRYLGMGPKRYMRTRRLRLVHQALVNADAATLVTDVAIRYGFYELGRFAGGYHKVFGELPSVTLRDAQSRLLIMQARRVA